jgi:hypothetical protein
VEARWPDSRPVSRQPMAPNGTRCRPPYEARDARISILARVRPETGYVDADWSDQIANRLQTGRAIRLAPDAER